MANAHGSWSALLPIALVPLVACYGSAPPTPPRIPLPPPVDGAAIMVQAETRTEVEQVEREARTCPQGHPESCTTTKYWESAPVTRTHASATYGGNAINYAQFKVMTDPQYDHKVAQLAALSHVCRRANVPRYLGLVGLIGGVITANVGAARKPPNTGVEIVGFGAIAGGIASYAAGYYAFGGRECTMARRLYQELDLAEAQQWREVQGEATAAEMETLAAQFNARRTSSVSQGADR
jgi:hypothetical protein